MSRANKELKARRRRQRGGSVQRPGIATMPLRTMPASTPRAGRFVLSYTINFDAVEPPQEADPALHLALREEDRQALHNQIYADPANAIPQLEALREKFPNSQMLMNWLASAYSHAGQPEKANELTRLNYELHPNYLFARLNYAQVCLAEGQMDRVRDIFEDKFDLKLMYPHRDEFHISEFIGFCSVAVEYFMRTGEVQAAHALFDVLEEMCPDHPVTNQLRQVMEGSLLLRLAKSLQRKMLGRGFLRR